jgi:hypothetical protein
MEVQVVNGPEDVVLFICRVSLVSACGNNLYFRSALRTEINTTTPVASKAENRNSSGSSILGRVGSANV